MTTNLAEVFGHRRGRGRTAAARRLELAWWCAREVLWQLRIISCFTNDDDEQPSPRADVPRLSFSKRGRGKRKESVSLSLSEKETGRESEGNRTSEEARKREKEKARERESKKD